MKRYIRAMSTDKDRAGSLMRAYSSVIIEHIIKLLVYSDIRPQDVDGWITSVAKWIHAADDFTLKPKTKKPREEMLHNNLFCFMGDTYSDYVKELYGFLADNRSGKFNHDGKGSYPEFDVTPELAKLLMQTCCAIEDATMPLLLDKADHEVSEYRTLIASVFSKLT